MAGPAETAAAVQHLASALCSGYNLAHFARVARNAAGARRLAALVLAAVSLAFLAGSAVALAAWRLVDVSPLVETAVAALTLSASASVSVVVLRRQRRGG